MEQMGGGAFTPREVNYDVEGTIGYKPETSWNYEVGTHLTNAKQTLQADFAVFYVQTKDQQIAQFAPSGLGRITVNKDESTSYGAEASLKAQLTNAFSVNANYGYTYATFKANNGSAGTMKKYVPFVPKHTFTLGGQYVIALRDAFLDDITLSANYTGQGRIYWTLDNYASQKFYGTLNGQVGFRKGDINLDVWIHNALDSDNTAFYFESRGLGFRQQINPLQVGVNLRCRF